MPAGCVLGVPGDAGSRSGRVPLGKRRVLRFASAMPKIVLASETDWDGWRSATRALVLAGVAPEEIQWAVGDGKSDPLPAAKDGFNVPRALVAMASLTFQAREPDRLSLLYRLIWRANAGEKLADGEDDPDLVRARGLSLAVRADAHRMRTAVRFMEVEQERFLGWYAPVHRVLEANAQLMVRRFAGIAFSILTPDGSAHWDCSELRFAAQRSAVGLDYPPRDDEALRRWWHSHHARLLREAKPGTSIPEAEPLDESPRPPDRPPIGPVVLPLGADAKLTEAVHEAGSCRRCHLYQPATQTVFGEGPAGARVMFIGEQPGDQEDVIGRPFVGPAGQIMDKAMEEAGIDRRAVYVTNAVKHFKFTPRGKRRIHQTPETIEITACRFWLDVERVQVKPALVVLMGATAARAVLQRPVTIGRERGRPFKLTDGQMGFITVHPSFLLRVPDADAKAREYRAFVRDLQAVRKLIESGSVAQA